MPLVSIITPIYNGEQYLDEAIQSVLAQRFTDWELILVDDGSKDGSGAICDGYAGEKIRVIHQENQGVSVARNNGIAAAQGKYLAFLDADDCYAPEFLARMCNRIEEDRADLCICGYLRCGDGGEGAVMYPELPACFGREGIVGPLARRLAYDSNCGALWNKVFRRALVQAHGLRMPPGVAVGEDRDFILQYLAHCQRVCYVPEALYRYRVRPDSAAHAVRGGERPDRLAGYRADIARFAALGIDPEAAERMCWEVLVTGFNGLVWRFAESRGPQSMRQLRLLLRNETSFCLRGAPMDWLERRFKYSTAAWLVIRLARLRCAWGVRLVVRIAGRKGNG